MPATDSTPAPTDIEVKKPETAVEVKEAVKVADTIKEQEADEPILQENPHRFVLFPLKYHEIWQSTYTIRRATRTLANALPHSVQEGRSLLLDC